MIRVCKAQAALTKVVESVKNFKSQYGDHEDMGTEVHISAEEEDELSEEIHLQTQLYDKVGNIGLYSNGGDYCSLAQLVCGSCSWRIFLEHSLTDTGTNVLHS